MAETVTGSGPGDSILSKIREEAYKSKEATEHHESLIEHLQASVMNTDELKTTFVKAAEEEAEALASKEKADQEKAAQEKAAAEVARKQRIEQMTHFQQLGQVLKTQQGQLVDTLKDDFKQLTAGISMISDAPGIKSIIAILKAAAMSLASILLINLKNSGILGSLGDRISLTDTGVIDWKQSLMNFKPDWMLDDKDKKAKEKAIGKEKETRDKKLYDEVGDDLGMNEPKKDLAEKSDKPGFMQKMNEGFQEKMQGLGETFGDMGGKMKKAGGKLKGMGGKLMGVLGKVGRIFMMMATGLWSVIVTVATAVGSFIAGLAASAMSMLVAAAPLLLKALLIAAIVAGLIFIGWYVYKKFQENKDYIMAKWEQIKESFMIAMDGLVLWKDKAVTFISNIFNKMWLGIRSLFVAVVEGIESAINYIISGVNALIPGEKYDIEPVDIGAGRMRAELDADYAAFEAEQATQAQEFADREKGLADRKAANTMDRHLGNTVVQTNQTVNEGNKSTTVMPSGTTPVDTNAANMALAQ